MKKWKIPKIVGIQSADEFFLEICEINRASKNFSQRELAKFLKWPVSYIPDVIKKRKPFTIKRALEFVKLFAIHPIDAENLIFMAMLSQQKEPAELSSLRKIKSPQISRDTFAHFSFFKFDAMLIAQAVARLAPNASLEKIVKLAETKKIDPDNVERSLALLIEQEVIEKKDNLYKLKTAKAFYDDIDLQQSEMIDLQKAFIESAKLFYDDFTRPATGCSAFVIINKKRYDEVREKFLVLKNWLLETSHLDSNDPLQETYLFQFEQHLIPVFNPEKLEKIRS